MIDEPGKGSPKEVGSSFTEDISKHFNAQTNIDREFREIQRFFQITSWKDMIDSGDREKTAHDRMKFLLEFRLFMSDL